VAQLLAKSYEDASAPVTLMLVIDSGSLPELIKVTDWDAVAIPTASEPNAKLAVDRDTAGPSPVPPSAIDCGELPALSTMVMAAERAPPVVGPKCPWMLQFAPAARLVPQSFAKSNEDASAPVTLMLVMDRASLPVLARVTACDTLAVPTACEPNVKLAADRDTVGPSPVPFSATLCGEPAALSVMTIAAVSAPTAVGAKCP
jgi:hypothetical protein